MAKGDAFWQLTPLDRRRAIVMDVVVRLGTAFVPDHRGWLASSEPYGPGAMPFEVAAVDPEQGVDEVLVKTGPCHACALGAMFICAVEDGGQLKVSDLDGYRDKWHGRFGVHEGDVLGYLSRSFEERQLALIECAYERGEGSFGTLDDCDCGDEYQEDCESYCHQAEFQAAIVWRPELTDPTARMAAIMESIANDPQAEFHPEVTK